ncbi:uncharacterized protein LOC131680921 [Topomyia yanbarensis]|uniref:uncharacterized protein LOC131680921 n=1 Tax=Topomyia yanbarensis TaxID=2498891 RepID=UPI00273BB680|nr:uncharacterized protein LOC131680921 [Topomyia yanbarensis]
MFLGERHRTTWRIGNFFCVSLLMNTTQSTLPLQRTFNVKMIISIASHLSAQSAAGRNSYDAVIPSVSQLVPLPDNSTSCSPRAICGDSDHRAHSPETWNAARYLSHDTDGAFLWLVRFTAQPKATI